MGFTCESGVVSYACESNRTRSNWNYYILIKISQERISVPLCFNLREAAKNIPRGGEGCPEMGGSILIKTRGGGIDELHSTTVDLI